MQRPGKSISSVLVAKKKNKTSFKFKTLREPLGDLRLQRKQLAQNLLLKKKEGGTRPADGVNWYGWEAGGGRLRMQNTLKPLGPNTQGEGRASTFSYRLFFRGLHVALTEKTGRRLKEDPLWCRPRAGQHHLRVRGRNSTKTVPTYPYYRTKSLQKVQITKLKNSYIIKKVTEFVFKTSQKISRPR